MGIDPLPSQLKLDEVSPVLKSRLWALIHAQIQKNIGNGGYLHEPMRRVARQYMIERANILIDEWENNGYTLVKKWKKNFAAEANFSEVLGFIEWFARALRDHDVSGLIANILIYERAAYRLEDGSIIPVASPEEGGRHRAGRATHQECRDGWSARSPYEILNAPDSRCLCRLG